jgi:hypothetical protein
VTSEEMVFEATAGTLRRTLRRIVEVDQYHRKPVDFQNESLIRQLEGLSVWSIERR